MSFGLKPIYDRLSEIRAELENLVLTRRWSLRETDLWNYSLSLQEIDKMRIDGKFVDSEGNNPAGQYVGVSSEHNDPVLNGNRSFYIFCADVTVSSIGCSLRVSQYRRSSCPWYVLFSFTWATDLMTSQANKLSTVKKCLNEVLKYGGPFNPRDLYPVSL